MVACPYHGFGSHEEAVEPIHCRVVPELHRHRRLVLQLGTNMKMVKTCCSITSKPPPDI